MTDLSPSLRAAFATEIALALPHRLRLKVLLEIAASIVAPTQHAFAQCTAGIRHSYPRGSKPRSGRKCKRCDHVDGRVAKEG